MIATRLFGRTGHQSSRVIFGAAALAQVSQPEADAALEKLLEAGINHIDVAASYGDAEQRVGPWMDSHRSDFFLATKTGERTYAGAHDQIRRSLERLRVDQVDLLQLHNLVKPDEWEVAMGPEGALKAVVEAREEGLVRHIGVTGHGTRVAATHLRSLEFFDFDSVLLPYNFSMMQSPEYAEDFERLLSVCDQRGVAVQTIKAVARRRWLEDAEPTHTTWYEPLTDPGDIEQAVHWALARPALFVNSASDLGILWHIVEAAASFAEAPLAETMVLQSERLTMQPLFIRGFRESV